MKTVMLATDLDATLVGDAEATQKILASLQPLRARGEFLLVYATGRSLASYQQLNLPAPDALIAAAGTEIYLGNTYAPVPEWADIFSNDWDRDAIVKLCSLVPNLSLQPESEQRPFKISYTTSIESQTEVQKLRTVLADVYPNAQLSVSHSGQYIDILPTGCDKGMAVQYVAGRLSIEAHNVICAGDGGNDIAMLSLSKAIIVGNAYGEVNEWKLRNPHVPAFVAQKAYADGIAEGLAHFGVVLG